VGSRRIRLGKEHPLAGLDKGSWTEPSASIRDYQTYAATHTCGPARVFLIRHSSLSLPLSRISAGRQVLHLRSLPGLTLLEKWSASKLLFRPSSPYLYSFHHLHLHLTPPHSTCPSCLSPYSSSMQSSSSKSMLDSPSGSSASSSRRYHS
jgi:hypothetical protein